MSVSVQFRVPYKTAWGQNVFVVGSSSLIGDWNPRSGKKMKYHDGVWELTLLLSISEGSLLYKYCILDDTKENGGVPHWEPGLDRVILLQSNQNVIRSDTWGEGKKMQEIVWPGDSSLFKGKLFRSPMPFSPMFDPYKSVYKEYKDNSIDVIVCLSYQSECIHRTDGIDLIEKYGRDGLAVIYHPIDDLCTPKDIRSFPVMIDKIATLLKKGCNIVVHCHAGIGRTGLTICCLAKKYLLVSNDNLIPWIRNSVRGAVQTHEQELFVHNFK